MFKDLKEENVVLSNKLDKANHEIARLNRIISQISHKPQQYQGGFH
jgi:FtsZ-binding cell division protein ZapB